MNEELHEITYTARLTRSEIEGIVGHDGGHEQGLIDACREWLANNPQGMTRDEFNALPDGSVVRLDDSIEYIKVGNRLGLTNHFDRVAWLHLDDQSLPDMTVVSTPPAPTLDDVDVVLDCYNNTWRRINDENWWSASLESRAPTTRLLIEYAPLTPLLPGSQIGGEA